MLHGLFINNKKSQDSIYESGNMVYKCLQNSSRYQMDYHEVDLKNRKIKKGYDFYFFNYHPVTMDWLDTKRLKKDLGFVITMILEIEPNNAFVLCPKNDFNFYCALDPTLKTKNNLYAFPRPLEEIKIQPTKQTNKIPIIGTFGFATKGKGFHHLIDAVNKEFDNAIVRMNIPYGDFVKDSEKNANLIESICRKKAKSGIELSITHEYMNKEQLINWCSENTINCFLYDRDMPGLSATTDQAIVSGKPLLVSKNETFRHILKYLKPYPEISIKDAIAVSGPIVEKIKSDWSPEKFRTQFEIILNKYNIRAVTKNFTTELELPIIENQKVKNHEKIKKILRNLFSLKKWKKRFKALFNHEII